VGGFFTLDPDEKRDRELIEAIPVHEVAYSLCDALRHSLRLAKPEGLSLIPETPKLRILRPPLHEALI
jgi:hypothetical protein